MKPEEVPEELHEAFRAGAYTHWSDLHNEDGDYRDCCHRAGVAAVLTHLGLSTEYGIRITYTSTRTEEGPVAETLAGALDVLARFDAQARPDVLRRVLTERWVGEPREIGSKEAAERAS